MILNYTEINGSVTLMKSSDNTGGDLILSDTVGIVVDMGGGVKKRLSGKHFSALMLLFSKTISEKYKGAENTNEENTYLNYIKKLKKTFYNQQNNLIENTKKSDLYQNVLKHFPDAELIDVKSLKKDIDK